ncbi:Spermidine/putrescine import ATP-binding protein PotA [Bacillus sonorensis]|uniref:Spermidine/putrescine import ATP-binding protein PotA n=1 Tax=Bacillus sonorensis TaxID=119858 RepID=A0ABM6LNQ7_9BACI|nr:Spermidine/putrescine import ATP-binding protein PotA [Bacillus sonorensis]
MTTILEFKDVCYWYKNQDQTLFEDANIEFKQGKFYTIVGTSGSGKTTFLSLAGGWMFRKKATSSIKAGTFPKSG